MHVQSITCGGRVHVSIMMCSVGVHVYVMLCDVKVYRCVMLLIMHIYVLSYFDSEFYLFILRLLYFIVILAKEVKR